MAKTTRCKTKWIPLTIESSSLYEVSVITCKMCHRIITPRFVHADKTYMISDYCCHLCGSDGNVKYFCMTCNRMVKEEDDRTS